MIDSTIQHPDRNSSPSVLVTPEPCGGGSAGTPDVNSSCTQHSHCPNAPRQTAPGEPSLTVGLLFHHPDAPPQFDTALSPHRLPWFSLSVSVLAALLWFSPEATSLLQYDRTRPLQIWRFLSCHLTHWTSDMAFWDIAVFAVLGTICERADRRRFAVACLVSAVAVTAGVWLFEPGVTFYRGLSGIDSALFGLVAVTAIRRAREQSRPRLAWGIGLAFILFAAKTLYEVRTGSGFFVPARGTAMRVLPITHLAGMASGAIVGIWRNRSATPRRERRTIRKCTAATRLHAARSGQSGT